MTDKKTITTIFIVPTLEIGRDKLKDNGFLNGYIKDARKDYCYEDAAYLLFKPADLGKFKTFLDEEYERTESIVDEYDYEEGYVVIVYKLNPKFKKDFELVKEGKYSLTSSKFQEIFPKIVKIVSKGLRKDEISLQYRVFNKTEDMIKFWEEKLDVTFDDDQEVWYGFEEENEILNLDKIKQHV